MNTNRKMKAYGKRLLGVAMALVILLASTHPSYASSPGADGEPVPHTGSSASVEEWRSAVLASLMSGGPTLQHAAEYIIANDVQIQFRTLGAGAMWWIDGNMYLNSDSYSLQTRPDHPYMLALIAHEAKHLEQGPIVALSVYGELEAWQVQYEVFKELTGASQGTYEQRMAWDELSQIPPSYARDDLEKARELIQYLAGPDYPIYDLPLWPMPAEIAERLDRVSESLAEILPLPNS